MFSVYLLRVNKTIKNGGSPGFFLRNTMINGSVAKEQFRLQNYHFPRRTVVSSKTTPF